MKTLKSMSDDDLATLYNARFQGRLLSEDLNEEDEAILQEVDRRAEGDYYHDDENIYNLPSIRQSIEEDRK